jgi:hypothetical protein
LYPLIFETLLLLDLRRSHRVNLTLQSKCSLISLRGFCFRIDNSLDNIAGRLFGWNVGTCNRNGLRLRLRLMQITAMAVI